MEKFVWSEEYNIGINEIDGQHKHFLEIANKIIDVTIGQNPTKEQIFNLLEELGNYAFYHFGIEEGYFDKFNYQEAPLHIDAHNNYRETIRKYLEDIRKEDVDINKMTEEIVSYSTDWLLKHIVVMDKKYTQYFHEHGLN
ncbi:hemerythrin family protein [Candidatus Wolfebacteria bacterium]|nr:hemerythrin family protein [Candidatus Wolfebacteria bacterium]